jgi:hypothetical protein
MKKYLLKYTDQNGKTLYSVSCGDHNASYALTIHKKDAQRFYGKSALKWIETRIKADQKYNSSVKNWGYTPEIEEIEEEPKWFFELNYAIEQLQKRNKSLVRKNFLKTLSRSDIEKINAKIKMKHDSNWENPDRIYVSDLWDLGLECLEKYYQWSKENLKEC